MPETTENFHRIPVNPGHGTGAGHRIVTITISDDEGIKAIYCGTHKVVLTYLFDVDRWTMAEAQAWIRERAKHAVMTLRESVPHTESEAFMDDETFSFQIKIAKKLGGGVIEGLASTPAIDRGEDIIDPEAFSKALATFLNNPVLLWNHDDNHPAIGQILKAEITDDGLFVRAQVSDREIWEKIKNGDLRAFSIGYRPLKWETETIDGKEVRIVKELDLLEISIVNVPMNQEAMFSMAKSVKSALDALEEKKKGTAAEPAGEGKKRTEKPETSPVNQAPMSTTPAKQQEGSGEEGAPPTSAPPKPETAPSGPGTAEGAEPAATAASASSDAGTADQGKAAHDALVEHVRALAGALGFDLAPKEREEESAKPAETKKWQEAADKNFQLLAERVAQIGEGLRSVQTTIESLPVRKTALAKKSEKFEDGEQKPESVSAQANREFLSILRAR